MTRDEAKRVITEWQGILPRILKLMYKETANNKFPDVQVSYGGGAWTNGKKLYVGLQPLLVEGEEGHDQITSLLGHEPTPAEGGLLIKSNGYHELYHIFFSDWKQMETFISWWTEEFKVLWDGKSEIHKNLVSKLGAQWNNSIEDGRIECLGGNEYPGTIRALQFSNILYWGIHSKNPSKSKFANFSMALCFYATTGIFPEWWEDMEQEMKDNMELIMGDIDEVIRIGSPVTARRKFQKTVLKIKPFILELLKQEMHEADTMQALQEFIQQLVDEFKGCSASGNGNGQPKDVGSGGLTIHIQMPSSSGDSSDESSESEDGNSSGNSGDEGDANEGKSGDSGKSEDDKDKKDEGSGSGKEKSEEKKDDGDGQGNESSDKSQSSKKNSIQNEAKAPNHAERGGKENNSSKQNPSRNNNGQGTSDGNVAPDKTDETVSKTKQELVDAVKEQLDAISEGANEELARDKARSQKAEKNEASSKDESLTQSEIEEIRNGYQGSGYYHTEGYKEVKVTAKAKPDNRVVQDGKKFRKEVEKLLKAQADTCIRGTTRGRLSPSMLYRMQRNDFGIFETKSSPEKTDAAVYILWDNSGSMCGTKQRLSTIACSVIEEGLKGLIPLKITAFSTEGGMVKHWKIKDFREKEKGHNYAWSHGTARSFNGGNKDGYSIKIATKEILKRPEKLKLLIVLSDGLPSDYPGTQAAMNDVKEAVKAARKSGVEVISVMFGEDEFRKSEFRNYEFMYKSGIIATAPEKLTSELVKQIRKILFNKGR